ncbi:MAG: hypothetical protein IPK10_13590 [Bacteroidetes bacterium]|nr:hypothetical protein [Bacteroidota bacterium]
MVLTFAGGKKSIGEAEKKGIDINILKSELENIAKESRNNTHLYTEWNPSFLAVYIINTHHAYVKEILPEMHFFTAKVTNVPAKNIQNYLK